MKKPFSGRKVKKAALAAEAEAGRRAELDAFERRIETALERPDPAVRILRLQEVRGDIQTALMHQRRDIGEAGRKVVNKGLGGTAAASTVATIAGATLTLTGVGGVVGLPIMMSAIPAMLGGMTAATVASGKAERRLGDELEPQKTALNEMLARVSALMEQNVAENVRVISASPLRDEVLAIGSLEGVFARAAARQMMSEEKPAQPVAEKKSAPKRKPGL